MISNHVPRLMLSAFGSHSGKTTVACALLKAFKNKGEHLSAYKCGPDYIDPMFHKNVLKTRSTNLDLFLNDENSVKRLICENSTKSTLSIIEGVMGHYDGLAGRTSIASSSEVAVLTNTPVVLIINARQMSMSLVPQINGFIDYNGGSNIKAIIFNNMSALSYDMYKELIEENCNVKVAGYLPNMPECVIESRHLGLITADEITNLDEKISTLADMAEKTIDFELLKAIAEETTPIEYEEVEIPHFDGVKIGVAFDMAFCFYYCDAIGMLERMGAEIVYFSPLNDTALPRDINAIILGGGYPELYGNDLANNNLMKLSVKYAIENKIPCIAECGGFMYLLDTLIDAEGISHEMVGAISGSSHMTKRLGRFGYTTLTAKEDNLLLKKGEKINAHEFHYSDSTNNGSAFLASKPITNVSWECIHSNERLFAGYPHINLYGNIEYAKRFMEAALKFKEEYYNG